MALPYAIDQGYAYGVDKLMIHIDLRAVPHGAPHPKKMQIITRAINKYFRDNHSEAFENVRFNLLIAVDSDKAYEQWHVNNTFDVFNFLKIFNGVKPVMSFEDYSSAILGPNGNLNDPEKANLQPHSLLLSLNNDDDKKGLLFREYERSVLKGKKVNLLENDPDEGILLYLWINDNTHVYYYIFLI